VSGPAGLLESMISRLLIAVPFVLGDLRSGQAQNPMESVLFKMDYSFGLPDVDDRVRGFVSVPASEHALFKFPRIFERARRSSPERTRVREELDRGRKPKRQGKSNNVLHGDHPRERIRGFEGMPERQVARVSGAD
jgi:hypothetical protein